MKTEMESKSLKEVRAWKRRVAEETKTLRGKTLLAYFNKAAQALKNKKAA